MNKVCRICKHLKNLDQFGTSKNKDGHDSRCLQCRRDMYVENRDHCLEKVKDGYVKNRKAKLVKKAEFYAENRNEILQRRRESWSSSSKIKDTRKNYWNKRKQLCYEKLGGKCCTCGHNNQNVLCIDHINGDGAQERKNGASLLKLWNKIIAEGPMDRYQILCFNCNYKKSLYERADASLENITKMCPTCLVTKDSSSFKSDKKYNDGKYYECRKCDAKRNATIKQLAFLKLGNSQCPCGISDQDMLTVDHIYGDGSRCRKIDGLGISLYRKLVAEKLDKNRFQVICFNCNILKSSNVLEIENVQKKYDECSYTPTSQFNVKDVKLVHKEFSEVVGLLENHHYAGAGRIPTIAYAGVLGEEVIAVFKFSSPVRAGIARSIGMGSSEVLELDRMCVLPGYHQKNLLSCLLSKVVKNIKEKFHGVKCLVTFADPEFGHNGTVYKAANWVYTGKTSRSYVYIDVDGNEHDKKTVYDAAKARGFKELEYAGILGFRRSYTVSKLKFIYKIS